MLCSELFVSFSCVYFVISPQFKPFWDFTISRTNLASIEKSAAGKVGLTLPRYQSPQWPSQKHENTGKLETIWLQYQRHPSNFIWQYLICQAQWRVSQHHSTKKNTPQMISNYPEMLTPHQFASAQPIYVLQSLPSHMIQGQAQTAYGHNIWKNASQSQQALLALLTSLTELVNYLTNGHLPIDLRPFLYGAQPHGLCKSNGDLRPIAVGCTSDVLSLKSAWDPSSQGSVSSFCPPK